MTRTTAYLGPEASFSHQAAVESLPDTSPIPLPSFGAILQAIQNREYDFAVLPIENSTNGSVVQALDLLAACGSAQQYQDVEVVDEHYLEVHHCLYASREWAQKRLSAEQCAALPVEGKDLESRNTTLQNMLDKLDIKTLYTHPQVWGQCNKILSALLPPGRVERVDMSSTSAAAAFVATHAVDGEGFGAISSELAGTKHRDGLVCLARNIEDSPGANTTRFLILRNKQSQRVAESGQKPNAKSLWTFTVSHHKPGALAQTLAIYAKHGFNLTAIQSRPQQTLQSDGAEIVNWRYVFFVESLITQHDQPAIDALLEDLSKVTERIVLLGSWSSRLHH